MKKNFSYLDLPKLPDFLVKDIYHSLNGVDNFPIKNDQYKSYPATENIVNFTRTIFDFQHNAAVQIIKDFLVIHSDIFRTTAYNYLIESGGNNVLTCFYDTKDNIIESHLIETGRWHRLNVSTRHNVINLTRPRIAITVHSVEEIPPIFRW